MTGAAFWKTTKNKQTKKVWKKVPEVKLILYYKDISQTTIHSGCLKKKWITTTRNTKYFTLLKTIMQSFLRKPTGRFFLYGFQFLKIHHNYSRVEFSPRKILSKYVCNVFLCIIVNHIHKYGKKLLNFLLPNFFTFLKKSPN